MNAPAAAASDGLSGKTQMSPRPTKTTTVATHSVASAAELPRIRFQSIVRCSGDSGRQLTGLRHSARLRFRKATTPLHRLSTITYDKVFEKRILVVTGHKQSCVSRLDSLTAELVSELASGKRELYVRDGSGRIVPLSELGRQNSARKRIIILGSRRARS